MKLLGYARLANTCAELDGHRARAGRERHVPEEPRGRDGFPGASSYIEDCGYGAVVRAHVTEHVLPQWGMTYFRCDGQNGKAAQAVFEALQAFIEKELTSLAGRVILESVVLPWSRMFEMEYTAKYRSEQ